MPALHSDATFERHYKLCAKAIEYMVSHMDSRPSLEQISEHVHTSPFHFQRIFQEYVGLSPKRFSQALTIQQAKTLLKHHSIEQSSLSLGLSSPSRLYDQFVNLEAMTPGEFKALGQALTLRCGLHDTPFGRIGMMTTSKGIFRLEFTDDLQQLIARVKQSFPNAQFLPAEDGQDGVLEQVMNQVLPSRVSTARSKAAKPLSLWVSGTNFQVNVWRALLNLQYGQTLAYGNLAEQIHQPSAARAVGTAVGANPIAMIIPCHRVLQKSGAIGGYRWGVPTKRAILAAEHGLTTSSPSSTIL